MWVELNQLIEAVAYYGVAIAVLRLLWARWRHVVVPAGLYVASYVIAQYVSPKLTTYIFWTVPSGNIPFVATLALMDIIVVKWGLSVGRAVVFTGFAAQVLLITANQLAILAPPAPHFELQEAYAQLLGATVRIAIASPLAYLAAELINVQLTWLYRRVPWQRTLFSDPIGLVIDTLVFVPVAFYGEVPNQVLIDMVVGLTAIKLSLIPFNILVIYATRRVIGDEQAG